jgi:hypothetical protein
MGGPERLGSFKHGEQRLCCFPRDPASACLPSGSAPARERGGCRSAGLRSIDASVDRSTLVTGGRSIGRGASGYKQMQHGGPASMMGQLAAKAPHLGALAG